ncbi:hypothetical protein [Hornefia porci]|uniref:hypothetical protein n=1 Tax=Hornefia porci TaxID=2652292 RepID=UPI001301163D|nr:hypothetical protein [Hornefia porci]
MEYGRTLRCDTKRIGEFFTMTAAVSVLYPVTFEVSKKWTMPIRNRGKCVAIYVI